MADIVIRTGGKSWARDRLKTDVSLGIRDPNVGLFDRPLSQPDARLCVQMRHEIRRERWFG